MKPQPSSHEQEHLAVQELLSWHAAGTLAPDERARVARHLETCAACRGDLAFERSLIAAEPAPPPGLDADAALARLLPRLQPGLPPRLEEEAGARHAMPGATAIPSAGPAQAAPRSEPGAVAADRARAAPRRSATLLERLRTACEAFTGGGWRNWALAGQFAVIAGLAALLLPGGPETQAPAYRALGSATDGGVETADVAVMFRPDARFDQVQPLLQASGARIVDGPTVTGAYLLNVDPAQAPRLLAALRAHPAVQLAEPLGAKARP